MVLTMEFQMLAAKGLQFFIAIQEAAAATAGHMKIIKEVLMDLLIMTFSNLLMKHADVLI